MQLLRENLKTNRWQQWGIENFAPLLPYSRKRKKQLFYVGLIITVPIVLIAIFAPQISFDPYQIDLSNRFAPPSSQHIFGTDHLGRDLWSRITYGARISLQVSISSIVLALLIGVPTGLTMGYFAGKLIDEIVMRIVDAMLTIPAIVLALLLRPVLGPNSRGLIVTIAIVYIPIFVRITRSLTLVEKGKNYIEAAYALGQRPVNIIFKHILPNIVPSIIILATTFIANAVIMEASFSFLGLGVSVFEPSWGKILSDNKPFIQEHSCLLVFPVSLIFLFILGLNTLGESLKA